jgi:hypothetical protein
MNGMRSILLCSLLVLLAGCETTSRQSQTPMTGDMQTDARREVSQGPAKDRVLWQDRLAAADMRKGDYGDAKRALDDVLLVLGGISAGDKSARAARGVFHEESKKNFRGEPYERAMAYFYRGVLYWMDGEPDNARACFRSGQFEDSDTEQKEYAGDYTLFDYLDGLASVKLAGDGSDAYKRAKASSRSAVVPPYDAQANVLFIAEYGHGPLKYASGEYGEQLRFSPGRSDASRILVRLDNQYVAASFFDDVTFQATTRGGRVMDHVLGNKAVFKSTTDIVGNVALIGGLAMATQRGTREAGLGLAAFGLVSKIVSAASTPAADTRCWDNLPQYLSFAALRAAPGEHTAIIEFRDNMDRPLLSLTKTIKFKVNPGGKDTVLFVSDQSPSVANYENQ